MQQKKSAQNRVVFGVVSGHSHSALFVVVRFATVLNEFISLTCSCWNDGSDRVN